MNSRLHIGARVKFVLLTYHIMFCIFVNFVGAYFCMNMILITLSTFLAVIIIQNHIRGDRKNKVPVWLKKVNYILFII